MYVCACVDFFFHEKNLIGSRHYISLCSFVLVWELHFNTLQSISTIRNVTIITKSIYKYRNDELCPDNATKKCTPPSTVSNAIFRCFTLKTIFTFSGHLPATCSIHYSIILQFACNIQQQKEWIGFVFAYFILFRVEWNCVHQ